MKDYQSLDNPKNLIGKYFEVRDRKFMITQAYWAYDNHKELCIVCIKGNPDSLSSLSMLYTLLPNEQNKYNLERISDKE